MQITCFLQYCILNFCLLRIIRAHNQFLSKRIKLLMSSHRDCYCNFKNGRVFPLVDSGNFPSHFSTALS